MDSPGRKRLLQSARQDFVPKSGSAVGSEHFALSGEDARDRGRAQTGRVIGLRAAQKLVEAGAKDCSIDALRRYVV